KLPVEGGLHLALENRAPWLWERKGDRGRRKGRGNMVREGEGSSREKCTRTGRNSQSGCMVYEELHTDCNVNASVSGCYPKMLLFAPEPYGYVPRVMKCSCQSYTESNPAHYNAL